MLEGVFGDQSFHNSPNRESQIGKGSYTNQEVISTKNKLAFPQDMSSQDEGDSLNELSRSSASKLSTDSLQLSATVVAPPQDVDTNKSPTTLTLANRSNFLPWNALNRSSASSSSVVTSSVDVFLYGDASLRPGEIVMRALFHNFTQQAEKKIELVMIETYDKSLSKLLQRGENPAFDQLLSALGSVGEHCLPSLLRALIAWHTRQISGRKI